MVELTTIQLVSIILISIVVGVLSLIFGLWLYLKDDM